MSANPLTSTLAALLESAASQALALDADARNELVKLDGQTLVLELTTLPNLPELAIRVNCHGENGPANRGGDGGSLSIMAESPHNPTPPNAIVRGGIADVVSMLWSEDLNASVTIEGDEQLLMALKRCFRGLSPNWRSRVDEVVGRLSGPRTGPGAGPTTSATGESKNSPGPGGQILQDVLGQAELAFDTLRATLGGAFESTREQAQSTTGKFWAKEDEAEDFARRLEDLQLEVDRLTAMVRNLSSDSSPDSSLEKKS